MVHGTWIMLIHGSCFMVQSIQKNKYPVLVLRSTYIQQATSRCCPDWAPGRPYTAVVLMVSFPACRQASAAWAHLPFAASEQPAVVSLTFALCMSRCFALFPWSCFLPLPLVAPHIFSSRNLATFSMYSLNSGYCPCSSSAIAKRPEDRAVIQEARGEGQGARGEG